MSNGDLASLFGLLGFFGILIAAGAAIALPFAVFSIAGSLRGIHAELRRMNGASSPPVPAATPEHAPAPVEPAVVSMGHRLLR